MMVSDDERAGYEPPEDDRADGVGGAVNVGSLGNASPGPVTAVELLRTALVDDADPRFPRWLPVPGALLGLGWAAYQATAGDAGVLPTVGVSTAIFAGTTLTAWLGWQLEID